MTKTKEGKQRELVKGRVSQSPGSPLSGNSPGSIQAPAVANKLPLLAHSTTACVRYAEHCRS